MDFSRAGWRKTTDVNRKYAVFELVDDGVVLLDVGFSDSDVFEIAFHEGVSNAVVDWDNLFLLLDGGRKLAEADK
jgi:hypothetical protein